MTVALKAGDMGCDYSGYRIDTAAKVAQFKQAGGKFVLRYSAGAASATSSSSHSINVFKLITPSEHKFLLANDIDIIANDEWYTTRITEKVKHPRYGLSIPRGLEAMFAAARLDLGSNIPDDHTDMLDYVSSAARADSAAALALWKSCGHEKGSSLYVSWDAAPVTSKFAAVDAYLETYDVGLSGYYHVDCYAGTPYLKHALSAKLIKYGWRPNAGSWSGDGLQYQPDLSSATKRAAELKTALSKTPAHIWQTGNYWFSKNADECMLLRTPVGSHFESIVAPPAPKPKPTPTPAPAVTEEDDVFVKFPNDKTHAGISDAAEYMVTGGCLLRLAPADVPAIGKNTVEKVTDHLHSALYKLPILTGTPDPRKGQV